MNTVELVLLSKLNGQLAVGIRVSFSDKVHREELATLDGYSVTLSDNEYEGYIIQADPTQPYVFVRKDMTEKYCEILGDL